MHARVIGVFLAVLALACGGSSTSDEQHGEESSGGSSGQTELEAMHVVCIEAADAVAGIQDAAQRDYDYSRHVGTHVTNPEIYQLVLSMIASSMPVNERAEILDQKAREVGLPDCSRSLFRQ